MTISSDDPAVQFLLDRAQVKDLIVRYIMQLESSAYEGGVDAVDGVREMITDDMTVDYVGGTLFSGADAWIEGFKRNVPVVGRTFHTLTNFIYDIEGDSAEVKFYINARHMWPEGDVMIGGAQYTSRLIRQPAGWRIAGMFLNVKWMHDPAGRLPPPGSDAAGPGGPSGSEQRAHA
jgi:hypothetical protein